MDPRGRGRTTRNAPAATQARERVCLLRVRPGRPLPWVICALLFFATTINYVDRAVLGVLAAFVIRLGGSVQV